MLYNNKSNQSSSNSDELLKRKAEFSTDSFKSVKNLVQFEIIISNIKKEIFGKIIKWKMGDFINCGSFSQVFRAMDCNTGKIFAVKKFNLYGPGIMEEDSLKEIEV